MLGPKITVVIPCYKEIETLEATLCSVLDQSYRNLELMVIDGQSCDGTTALLRNYAEEVTYWVSEPDGGPADAVRKALALATGELFTICPCDDVMMPGSLEHAADIWKREETPWIVGHTQVVDEGMNLLGRLRGKRPDALVDLLTRHEQHETPASTFYATELVRLIGGIDDTLRYAWPYDLACRLILGGYRPHLSSEDYSAVFERQSVRNAEAALMRTREAVIVAERYLNELTNRLERARVWKSCDDRRKILALAEAEAHASRAKSLMLSRVKSRPWWLQDELVRTVITHGPAHPLAQAA